MRLLLPILALLISPPVDAGTLSNLDIYKRCYTRMVRSVPLTTDSLYIAVSKGTKTGPDACIELFDRAAFATNGILKTPNSAEGRKILKTFNDVHRGWFQSRTLEAGPSLIHDLEEPALYFTRAAFQPGIQFKTVVTGATSLKGIRRPAQQDFTKFKSQRTILNYNTLFPYANSDDLLIAQNVRARAAAGYTRTKLDTIVVPSAAMVDLGHLVGVTTSPPFMLNNFYGEFSTASADRLAAADLVFATPFQANAHMGGGVIGSQAFLMSNMNLGVPNFPNGVEAINRRLTSRVFEDLLCHQMPTLTDADVAAETAAFVAAKSPHPFQQSTSCMRCHSSIDGMGYAMRNLIMFGTAGNPQIGTQEAGVRLVGVMKLPVVPNATTFALQPPAGRLHYREIITNTRRVANINSTAQMGDLLSQYNDIYYCAAKRYYYFLTGINVDVTQPPSNALDTKHYNKVKTLGAALKTSQSVRTLLYDIFKSEAFRSWNYLSTEEK